MAKFNDKDSSVFVEQVNVNIKGAQYQSFAKFKNEYTKDHFKNFHRRTFPRKLILESTNVCNASCIFCAYQYKEEQSYFMDIDLVDKVTKEYASFHPDSFISLTPSFGDTLVDPKIFKKVELCHENGIKRIQFYTNAVLLEKKVDDLIASRLNVLNISLAEFDKENYEKIYRNGKYEKVLAGIHKLLKRLKETKNPLPVHINFRSPKKLDDILNSPDFNEFIKPFVTDTIFFSDTPVFDNWGGAIKPEDLLPGMDMNPTRANDIKIPCRRLYDIQLLPNGDVRLCGARRKVETVYDDLIIGNLNQNTLQEIWYSEKFFEIAHSFFTGDVPELCRDCSLYEAIGEQEKRTIYIKDVE